MKRRGMTATISEHEQKRKWGNIVRKNSRAFWAPLCVVWIVVIFMFSRQDGAQSHGVSQSVARFIGGIMYPGFGSWPASEQLEWLESFDTLLRKLAHFAEYTLLGVLGFLSVSGIANAKRRKKAMSRVMCGLLTFYPCVLIAAVDEMIQIFSENRGASAADIVLDCVGALAGILLAAYQMNNRAVKTPAADQTVVKHRKG